MLDSFQPIPKILGADIEVANFIESGADSANSCAEAAGALLRELEGWPRTERRHATRCLCAECVSRYGLRSSVVPAVPIYDEQDRGRAFQADGSCYYIDLSHLEFCLPEVRSARDFVAAKRAARERIRRALRAANSRRTDDQKIVVLLNNSDRHSNSYGSHLNVLVSRECWERIFLCKLQHLLWLGAFQASAAVLFGAGKVGSENGLPHVRYQLSARSDFIETVLGEQTTYMRPLCNSRYEPICGRSRYGSTESDWGGGRLHVICFDHALLDGSSYLVASTMQCVVAMLEAGNVSPRLLLENPVAAMHAWSRDPSLRARAPLLAGGDVTALELNAQFLVEARAFHAAGRFDGIVPDAAEALCYWEETLALLAARDIPALARRIDWALKETLLVGALEARGLSWDSPAAALLDLHFSKLDGGLFDELDAAGATERLVDDGDVERMLEGPPSDTRAWTRGALLRRWGPFVDDVNWDFVRFRSKTEDGANVFRVVDLPRPDGHGREDVGELFSSARSLGDVLDGLGAIVERPNDWYRRYRYECV